MPIKPPRDAGTEVIETLQVLEDLVITVDFDRNDPHSIAVAALSVNANVDTTVAAYRGHSMAR